MPIIFISLNETFNELARKHGFEAKTIKIQDYIPNPQKRTYYVSPANSLGFMDGGIDYALSRIVFPGIEAELKDTIRKLGRQSLVGKYYLPIGSSIIIDRTPTTALIAAPTMLLPQNVSQTQNAYYATVAILYNIFANRKEQIADVDIIFTAFCCGYGKMDETVAMEQIIRGMQDYTKYTPANIVNKNIIIHEPTLLDQPKYYQNSEFFYISPKDIVNC